jgi:hypothetical protein
MSKQLTQRIKHHHILILFLLSGLQGVAGQKAQIAFRKQLIASESAESVGVFDVNSDQQLDLVSGSYWYEGPAFQNRHLIGQNNRKG